MIWCCKYFRFNAICKLSAAESERNGIWVGHHENHSIAFVSVEWREHIYIESRIGRRGLPEAGHRRGESAMEQRRNERNRFVVLSDTRFKLITITAFNYREKSIPCLIHLPLASSRVFQFFRLFCFSIKYQLIKIWAWMLYALCVDYNKIQNGN